MEKKGCRNYQITWLLLVNSQLHLFIFGAEFKLIFMVFIYGQWVGVIKFDMASFGDDFENLKNKDK
jgi:hypothetical protein